MLESERRQQELPPREVLDKLDIKKGDTVIDDESISTYRIWIEL